ncbi:hypothetical protein [Ottowia thiooxydans]|uniref:hypothetical protein n=1 Tax=Ottowia thiooxydans TaxID=219182 RepID=UPI00041020B5|nr:hypothetical protein [Ottowia thiooxydans]
MSETHIMIGTPAYAGMMHMDFVHSLLDYQKAGIRFALATLGNESLITRARNTILSMFHHRTDLTHLLFLDADVSLSAASLQMMLSEQRDVIGAPVALKGRNAEGARIFNIGRVVGESGPTLLVDRIGTAALMLSRQAVTALVEDAIAQGRVYQRMKTLRGDGGSAIHYDVFGVGVHEGEYLSEDFWACMTLRRLGFDICVLPDIVTHHHGTMAA